MLKRLLTNLITYLPAKVLPALTGFITAPILTRLLLPSEYADYALASGIAGLLGALACSGPASAVVRFLPTYRVKGEEHRFFATLGFFAGALIVVTAVLSALGLWLGRALIPANLYPLFWISVGIFVVESVYTFLLMAVLAQERSRVYTTFQLLTTYLSLGLGLFLIIGMGVGPKGLLWGALLSFSAGVPGLLVFTLRGIARPRPEHYDRAEALQMWRYAWPLALGNVAMWGLTLSDRYVIGFYRPAADVGLYAVAYNITGKSIDLVVALFMLASVPMLINVWEQQGRTATEEALAMITRIFLIVCFPAAAGLAVLALPFVAVLTAPAYHEGYRIVGYVAFSSFTYGLSQLASMGILIGMATWRIAVNQVVAAAVNIALNFMLVPRFGFVAAGVTTLLGYCVLLALQNSASHKILVWRFPFRTLRNVLLASTCMGLIILVIRSQLSPSGDNPFAQLLLSIAAAVPAYVLALLACGELNAEERRLARDFRRRVAARSNLPRS